MPKDEHIVIDIMDHMLRQLAITDAAMTDFVSEHIAHLPRENEPWIETPEWGNSGAHVTSSPKLALLFKTVAEIVKFQNDCDIVGKPLPKNFCQVVELRQAILVKRVRMP